jgi:CheY-like chemotaxis protein
MLINTTLAGLPIIVMKVLMAEDEDFHAEILLKMLQKLGFRSIDRARGGNEALKMAKKTSYHLVISDCHMPGMDGFDLVDHLRHDVDSVYAQVPIMMLTGDRDSESVQRAIDAGVSHYLAKPFELISLRQKILDVFEHKTKSIYMNHKNYSTVPIANVQKGYPGMPTASAG